MILKKALACKCSLSNAKVILLELFASDACWALGTGMSRQLWQEILIAEKFDHSQRNTAIEHKQIGR